MGSVISPPDESIPVPDGGDFEFDGPRFTAYWRHLADKLAQLPPKPEILARQEEIVAALRAIIPAGPRGEGVIGEPLRLRAYETDGLSAYRQPPLAVRTNRSAGQKRPSRKLSAIAAGRSR